MHNPRRQQVKHKRLIADLDRVSGVVPTLVARHDLETLSEQIDDLAFSFVAPLGANHCDYFSHRLNRSPKPDLTRIRIWIFPGRVPYICAQQLPRNYRLTFRCAESLATVQAAHKSKGLRVFFQAKPLLRKVQT